MTLADITIVPVRSDRKEVYLEYSRRMAAVYRDHETSSVVDYWQADGTADQDEFHAAGPTTNRAS